MSELSHPWSQHFYRIGVWTLRCRHCQNNVAMNRAARIKHMRRCAAKEATP